MCVIKNRSKIHWIFKCYLQTASRDTSLFTLFISRSFNSFTPDIFDYQGKNKSLNILENGSLPSPYNQSSKWLVFTLWSCLHPNTPVIDLETQN